MSHKKYIVDLTDAERSSLHDLITKGTTTARRFTRAHLLLAAAEGQTDQQIAATLRIGLRTVERTRQRFVEGGLHRALTDQHRPGGIPKLDGKQAAVLVAVACSDAPGGRDRWTMQLLADKLVELNVVESISDETVRRTLKKRSETLAETPVVHPAGQCGLCLAHGRCFGSVCRTAPGCLSGRLF